MPATLSTIKRWIEQRPEEATHLVIRCDSFDFRGDPNDSCCYPVYVLPTEDVHEKAAVSGPHAIDRLMEVYSFTGKHTIEDQLNEHRARHYD